MEDAQWFIDLSGVRDMRSIALELIVSGHVDYDLGRIDSIDLSDFDEGVDYDVARIIVLTTTFLSTDAIARERGAHTICDYIACERGEGGGVETMLDAMWDAHFLLERALDVYCDFDEDAIGLLDEELSNMEYWETVIGHIREKGLDALDSATVCRHIALIEAGKL